MNFSQEMFVEAVTENLDAGDARGLQADWRAPHAVSRNYVLSPSALEFLPAVSHWPKLSASQRARKPQ